MLSDELIYDTDDDVSVDVDVCTEGFDEGFYDEHIAKQMHAPGTPTASFVNEIVNS